MDSRTLPAADRVYEDFQPFYEWNRDDRLVTVLLPGYRRDQLKVQVTSKPALRLMGERLIIENRWRRFNLEFLIPGDYDTDKVTAKFEGGKLSVKFGELIKPKETTPQEPSQKVDQQKETPKEKEDKRSNGEVSDQKTPQKEKALGETETTDSTGKGAEEDRTNGLTERKEAATSKAPKTKDVKSVTRSKTRLVDFSLSFGASNQVHNAAIGDSTVGLNKWKKWVKWMVLILFVVGLGLYARNLFRSSHQDSNSQELIRSLIPDLLNR